ncbi:MAG: hypothetical protein AB7J13_03055 [Pyrinomonadaceae bacterium]
MKRIYILMACLSICLFGSIFAIGQTQRTVRGYFCGSSEGDGGTVSIRVGKRENIFSILNEEPEIKYVGFKNEKQKWLDESLLGMELVIGYVSKKFGRRTTNVVRKLTLTGKRDGQTKSCGFGLDGD